MTKVTPAILAEGQGRKLGESGLPELLPSSIGRDETMRLIAEAIELEIQRGVQIIPNVLLWPAISILQEPLLTHLAVMLHADWWDESWSLTAKRDFLCEQIELHRKKGTPWAVETAVGLVYGPARLREWFEYGGDRGCFKVEVDTSLFGLTTEQIAKIEMMIRKYKRKSQHLCGLMFGLSSAGQVHVGAANLADEVMTIYPYYPTELEAARPKLFTGAAIDMLEILSVTEQI